MNPRMSMSVQCPKCQKGFKVAEEVRNPPGTMQDPKVREILFNQRARA